MAGRGLLFFRRAKAARRAARASKTALVQAEVVDRPMPSPDSWALTIDALTKVPRSARANAVLRRVDFQ